MLNKLFNWTKRKDFWKRFETIEVEGVNYPRETMIDDLHKFLLIEFKTSGEKNVAEGVLRSISLDDIKYYLPSTLKKLDKKDKIINIGAHIFSRFLARGHPYVDGNKRTGWLFLIINNFAIDIDVLKYSVHSKQIKLWAGLETEETKLIPEIVDWIKNELKPILKK